MNVILDAQQTPPRSGPLARLEKMLVVFIASSFAVPLLLGIALWETQTESFYTVWLRNVTLHGVQVVPPPVALTRHKVLSARFQTAYAQRYDMNFAGRELLIRIINEIYLRALHTTHAEAVAGPHLSLVEPAYLIEYCQLRPDKDALRPLTQQIRRMQDFCDARGIAFALVITPSKAAIYPEEMPAAWMRRYLPGARYYDTFLPLLHEMGIHYVDGHRIALDMKATATVPVFPQGGIHWGEAASLATTNALLELLAREGLGVAPIRDARQSVSHHPTGQSRDMADLVNNLFPWRYPVMKVTVPPMAMPGYRPNFVIIGGSFVWTMLKWLGDCRQFSELEFYHYYNLERLCSVEGELHSMGKPTPPVDFEREFFAADSLVLEVNEQALHDPRHLVGFLHDALAVLPDPHAPRAPFSYQGRMEYRWGDPLSFVENQSTINMAATTGLTPPGPVGSYTVGSVASIHFAAPPPPVDMVLDVDAHAYLVDTRLTEQHTSVVVNGHPVGDWVWNDAGLSRRTLTIPKGFLGGGEVRLEFHVARPGSPSEFGLSTDSRKFGLIIPGIRFHEAGK